MNTATSESTPPIITVNFETDEKSISSGGSLSREAAPKSPYTDGDTPPN